MAALMNVGIVPHGRHEERQDGEVGQRGRGLEVAQKPRQLDQALARTQLRRPRPSGRDAVDPRQDFATPVVDPEKPRRAVETHRLKMAAGGQEGRG